MSEETRPDMAAGDEAPPEAPGAAEDVCPECDGSGKQDGQACPACGGSGTVRTAIGGG